MSDLTHPPLQALETRIPAPVVALLIAAAMHLLSPAVEPSEVLALVRKVLLDLSWQLSGLCALAAFLGFMRSRTTINPLKPERASVLVTDGIYRYTRNPMYLSLLLLLLGYAIDLWRWPALLGPVAYVAYITRFQILPEERVLEAKFGADYLGYKQKVRRWV
jgi:protein-S-isoprenylcysteine O-methyltransferase Ste14